MSHEITYQIRDLSGNWLTVRRTPTAPQLVSKEIESLQKTYKKDVRALDSAGMLVDYKPVIKEGI